MRPEHAYCRLCECPVVDGGVQASEVDEEKFNEWFLDVTNEELADELVEGDVICNFCVWDAEYLLNSREDEKGKMLKWWPNELPEGTLKSNFLAEKVKPCWVQLGKAVLMPESKDGDEEMNAAINCEKGIRDTLFKCFYCEKQVIRRQIAQHVKNMHKNLAIRCKKYNCLTYFHTQEEQEKHSKELHGRPKVQKLCNCIYCGEQHKLYDLAKHMTRKHTKELIRCDHLFCKTYFHTLDEKKKHVKEIHEIPIERESHECIYCGKLLLGKRNYKSHVGKVHPDVEIKCLHGSCFSYFKTRPELDLHVEEMHENTQVLKIFKCKLCEHVTSNRRSLEIHMNNKHVEKIFGCEKCGKKFATLKILDVHMRNIHTYKFCAVCHLSVEAQFFRRHFMKQKCRCCMNTYPCSGVLQSHWKTCKENKEYTCDMCGKSFKVKSSLEYHMNVWHINPRGFKYRNRGFTCKLCAKCFSSAYSLKHHLKTVHKEVTFECAHCRKIYHSPNNIKNHLAMEHDLIEKEHQCQICMKQFYLKNNLTVHIRVSHPEKFHFQKCTICGHLPKHLSAHMMNVHGIRK